MPPSQKVGGLATLEIIGCKAAPKPRVKTSIARLINKMNIPATESASPALVREDCSAISVSLTKIIVERSILYSEWWKLNAGI